VIDSVDRGFSSLPKQLNLISLMADRRIHAD